MRVAARTSERPSADSVIASIAPLCLRPAGNAPPAAGTRVHRRNNSPFAPALPQARCLRHDAANVATEFAALLGNGARIGVGRLPAENVTPQVASQPVPLTPVRLFFFQGGNPAAHARDATHTKRACTDINRLLTVDTRDALLRPSPNGVCAKDSLCA